MCPRRQKKRANWVSNDIPATWLLDPIWMHKLYLIIHRLFSLLVISFFLIVFCDLVFSSIFLKDGIVHSNNGGTNYNDLIFHVLFKLTFKCFLFPHFSSQDLFGFKGFLFISYNYILFIGRCFDCYYSSRCCVN